MNNPAGFRPINFRMAARIMLLLALTGLGWFAMDRLLSLYLMPAVLLPCLAMLLLISTYLHFFVSAGE